MNEPTTEFHDVNTARCRLRAALLVADALEKGTLPHAPEDAEELRTLAREYRPAVERALQLVNAQFARMRAGLKEEP